MQPQKFPNLIQWRQTSVKKAIVTLFMMLITCGCAVGPNYRRPKVDVPDAYRGAPPLTQPSTSQPEPQQASQSSEPSFGDQKWWDVFQDPQLQELIRTALKQNYDVRIAAAESWKHKRSWASHGLTSCRRSMLGLQLSTSASQNKKSLRRSRTKRVRTRWAPPCCGTSISGASTAAPPKQHARICWQPSGHAVQSPTHW